MSDGLDNVDTVTVRGNSNDKLNNNDINTVNEHIKQLDSYIADSTDLSKLTYGQSPVTIIVNKFGRPFGYFNDNGQWVDANPQINHRVTDWFPDSKIVSGGPACVDVAKKHYWLVDASDRRKNYGEDGCKFDMSANNAFAVGSWGAPNYYYYVNKDGSLANGRLSATVAEADRE